MRSRPCLLTEGVSVSESMGASLIPVLFFTVLWGVVAGILPFVIPRSPHKSVIQVKEDEDSFTF